MKYSAQEVGLFTKELLKVVWFQSIKGGRLGLLVRFANEFFVFLIDYMNLYLFDECEEILACAYLLLIV